MPREVRLLPADGMAAIRRGAGETSPRCCYVCHEIGSGPYYAYLWGAELRAYFDLPAAGHMLATNLHADTCQQARAQICTDNGVSEEALRRMNLMVFMSVRRGGLRLRRRIDTVWDSDCREPHRLVFSADSASTEPSTLISADDTARARRTIDQLMADGARTIEQVRAAIVSDRGE